ncbi:MAG: hypothetical protein V4642_12360 [Bacteroidota bacterium]
MFLKNYSLVIALVAMATMVSGCELIGDVIEFGLWLVLIIVVLVGGIAAFAFKKLKDAKNKFLK